MRQEEEMEPLHEEPEATPNRNENLPPAMTQSQVTAPLAAVPGANFEGPGLGMPGFVIAGAPPDTTLAVGPNHIVAWVNTQYAVFDKSGTALLPPPGFVNGNTLFTGMGNLCETTNRGERAERVPGSKAEAEGAEGGHDARERALHARAAEDVAEARRQRGHRECGAAREEREGDERNRVAVDRGEEQHADSTASADPVHQPDAVGLPRRAAGWDAQVGVVVRERSAPPA